MRCVVGCMHDTMHDTMVLLYLFLVLLYLFLVRTAAIMHEIMFAYLQSPPTLHMHLTLHVCYSF